MKLVLGEQKVSVRQACRQVLFGEGYPNIYRTVGNMYKRHFGDAIGLAKHLSQAERKVRIDKLDSEWVEMGKPGNPNWQSYLTPDEEKLIVCFLQTCNFMHMPFNRDAFKVSTAHALFCKCTVHAHTTQHTYTYTAYIYTRNTLAHTSRASSARSRLRMGVTKIQ